MNATNVDPLRHSDLKWCKAPDFYLAFLDRHDAGGSTYAEKIAVHKNRAKELQKETASFHEHPERIAYVKTRFKEIAHGTHVLHDLAKDKALSLGRNGLWVAAGRPLLDADFQIIPACYWSLLEINWEMGVAIGQGRQYSDLRIVEAKDIPSGHALWSEVDEADLVSVSQRIPTDRTKQAPELLISASPGRPSAMHLIELELERRAEAGALQPTLMKESESLATWLRSEHPDLPSTSAKTIRNRLRNVYKEAKARN